MMIHFGPNKVPLSEKMNVYDKSATTTLIPILYNYVPFGEEYKVNTTNRLSYTSTIAILYEIERAYSILQKAKQGIINVNVALEEVCRKQTFQELVSSTLQNYLRSLNRDPSMANIYTLKILAHLPKAESERPGAMASLAYLKNSLYEFSRNADGTLNYSVGKVLFFTNPEYKENPDVVEFESYFWIDPAIFNENSLDQFTELIRRVLYYDGPYSPKYPGLSFSFDSNLDSIKDRLNVSTLQSSLLFRVNALFTNHHHHHHNNDNNDNNNNNDNNHHHNNNNTPPIHYFKSPQMQMPYYQATPPQYFLHTTPESMAVSHTPDRIGSSQPSTPEESTSAQSTPEELTGPLSANGTKFYQTSPEASYQASYHWAN